ncbi:protein angel homolog 2 isoform X2 [Gouania willdenowi]|uniref:protein angel homolog 2 isoform X2 n=1 Tax=Gouania willdenowi TaxID=441366 RepID=UPI001056A7ED|nr:protein angel homolog 2-like isoform X2 [Gouania willdenowi]
MRRHWLPSLRSLLPLHRVSTLSLSSTSQLMDRSIPEPPPLKRRRSYEENVVTPELSSDQSSRPGQWAEPNSTQSNVSWSCVGGASTPGPQVKVLHRAWESCCRADVCPPGVSRGRGRRWDFSVLSYNILSQQLLEENLYLYRHAPPHVLRWELRLHNLIREITQLHADIVCLQEVQHDHYESHIKAALHTLGYHCEYKKRTGSKPDGCVVAFRTCRFSLVSSNPVEFFRPGDALLDRDNVGLVVLLRPLGTDWSLCVANTHLLYNPRRGDVKLAQLAVLLAEVARMSRLPDGSATPVLLCGDFNSTPWSPLYHFLTNGRLDCRGLTIGAVSGQEFPSRGHRLLSVPLWSHTLGINQQCQYEGEDSSRPAVVVNNRAVISHTLRLWSSYKHRLNPDGRSEVTTCHSHTAITVDYILYTPVLGGRGLQLLGKLSLVGERELEEVNGLPNQHHPSDHLPLLATFRLHH